MSAPGRLCCKSLKTPGDKFPARSRNEPLPKSPVSLSPGDEVPTCLLESRVYSSKNLRSTVQKTFTTQSPGEFNRSVQHQLQSIGRGFEGQGLSRALIEPQSNAIEVGLGEAREIGSSREVLSQQAVGVLVAATLPWTARITEVNLHVGGNREAFRGQTSPCLGPTSGSVVAARAICGCA